MPGKSLFSVSIVHSIKGRIRLEVAALKYLTSVQEELNKSFNDIVYFKSVSTSTITGRILIYYDEKELNIDDIIEICESKLNPFALLALRKHRENKNNISVKERNLEEVSSSTFLKRIAISSVSLAVFAFRSKKIGILNWRSNLFSLPSLISLGLSKDIFKSGTKSIVYNKKPNADTLTMSAIVTGLVTGRPLTALTTILLSDIAEFMTAYTMEKTRNAISDILSIGDRELFLVNEDGSLTLTPIEKIKVNDVINVQTGDKLSVDGSIILGQSLIDESAITGEYLPRNKNISEEVFAGTIIKSGNIHVRVSRVGDDTIVSRIVKMVEGAESRKAQIQNFADKFSAKLIPLNFLLAMGVYAYTKDINRALNMMIIDYSCGVRLSTATAISASLHNAAKNGVLIKGGNYIEDLSKANSIVLDKTGTITEGRPKIVTVKTVENVSRKEIIELAAAAEENSNHPLAFAVLENARKNGYTIPVHGITNVEVGKGVSTEVDGHKISVGNRKFMDSLHIDVSEIYTEANVMEHRGEIVIYVADNDKCIGVLGLHDALKDNMRKALNRLRNLGFDDVRMLTGDLYLQAEKLAYKMNLDDFEAELLPEDKAKTILSMQEEGTRVIMVGDGINDAPALAYSDIGIALGTSTTDVAIESASVSITNDDPLLIPSTIVLARKTMNVIRENFAMVIGINSFGIVFSALGYLPVIFASILHNSSTILVVLNSGRILLNNMERRSNI